MKKIILLLSIPFLMLTSCSLGSSSGSGSALVSGSSVAGIKHYEEDLSLSNYTTYFECGGQTSVEASRYDTLNVTFQGVLSYALYQTVIVGVSVDCTASGLPSETIKQSFNLNAAGNGSVAFKYDLAVPGASNTLYFYKRVLTITSISGKVIFDI